MRNVCVCCSVIYVLLILVLLYWRRSNFTADPINSSRVVEPAAALVSGLLCLPPRRPKTLLVEIPFTTNDIGSLELTVGLWEHKWPCYQAPNGSAAPKPAAPRPDLVLGFNGNLSEPAHMLLRRRLAALAARRVVTECFGHITVESAHLSGTDDTYDKRRLDANWTLGPNKLFFHFLRLLFLRIPFVRASRTPTCQS